MSGQRFISWVRIDRSAAKQVPEDEMDSSRQKAQKAQKGDLELSSSFMPVILLSFFAPFVFFRGRNKSAVAG